MENISKAMQAVFKERRAAIVAYRNKFPDLSLEAIGECFGISKQRVSQILKEELGNGNDSKH